MAAACGRRDERRRGDREASRPLRRRHSSTVPSTDDHDRAAVSAVAGRRGAGARRSPDVARARASSGSLPRRRARSSPCRSASTATARCVAHEPDLALTPASNQKLLTAYARADDARPVQRPRRPPSSTGADLDVAGNVAGDLVLAAGGDPTLTTRGPHSLSALADQVAASGVTSVTGARGARRCAPRVDPHPVRLARLPGAPVRRSAVGAHGRRQRGAGRTRRSSPTRTSSTPEPSPDSWPTGASWSSGGVARSDAATEPPGPTDPTVLASVESVPVGSIVADLLLTSDNESADLLLREVGLVASGEGTLDAGAARVQEVFARGASTSSAASATAQASRSTTSARPANSAGSSISSSSIRLGPAVLDSLPVAAETGTLSGRFVGTSAAGGPHRQERLDHRWQGDQRRRRAPPTVELPPSRSSSTDPTQPTQRPRSTHCWFV